MTKFCPECGFKQKDENNHFCSNCGYDFSKLESSDKDSNSPDNSSINVPINSDSKGSPDSSPVSSDLDSSSVFGPISSSSDNSSSVSKPRTSVSKISHNSNNQRKSNSSNKSRINNSSNGFLSNLTFNKCFLAFALLLIIMVIGGMLVQTTQEPYSDNGLTSFMDSSGHNDLSDIWDESSYDNDDSEDYLSFDDDSNDILGHL